jgi:hypothetical protein
MTSAELSALVPLDEALSVNRWAVQCAERTEALPKYVNHHSLAVDDNHLHWWLVGYKISAYPTPESLRG